MTSGGPLPLEPPTSSPSDCPVDRRLVRPGSAGATGRPKHDHDACRALRGSNRSRGAEPMDGATVSVAVVASRTEAELIVGMLRSYGLRAAVAADDAGGQEPQLQLQGVRVLVAPDDEASARQLLADAEETPSS